MPPVLPPPAPGPLGLVLPPTHPRHLSGRPGATLGSTDGAPSGATAWITGTSRDAEAVGAGAVWATDHLFWGVPTLECTTALALAVSATRQAVVGSCVLQLPMRSPAVVAKQASSLQLLSEGRFILGVGVGSHEREYALAGARFAGRGRALDAGIAAVRRAWTVDEAGYRHDPALPAPIWVGGSSAAAMRRAAVVGDGWIPLFVDPSAMADAVAELRAESAAAGRDPAAVTPAAVMVTSIGSDAERAAARGAAWLSALYGIPAKAFARHLVAGSPERCADVVTRYFEAGVAHVAVFVAGEEPVDQFAALAASALDRTAPAPAVLAGVGA